MSTPRDPALDQAIETIRRNAVDWTRRYGLRVVGVIGSVGRGQARSDSDLDLLADIDGHPSLLELDAFEAELREVFGRKVDVVVRSSLPPHWRAFAEGELVAA